VIGLKPVFRCVLFGLMIQSCSNANDVLYSKLENNLQDSVQKYHAKAFEYTDFVLYPQQSYFVNAKLKLLTLKNSAEFCDDESHYWFDPINNQLILEITRQICYEDANRWQKISDTICLSDYQKNIDEKYVDGKLVKREKFKKPNGYNDLMYDIKTNTERKYNGR
jgi:hypothetical protein